eukprot:11341672-Ditylum_brightwellii.AAC.1
MINIAPPLHSSTELAKGKIASDTNDLEANTLEKGNESETQEVENVCDNQCETEIPQSLTSQLSQSPKHLILANSGKVDDEAIMTGCSIL